MTNRERDLTFRSLICVAAGVLGLAVVAIAFTIWALRSDAAEDAARELGNTATILAEQTSRTVQSIDLVLKHLEVIRADLRVVRESQIEHGLKLDRLEELLANRKELARAFP